MSESKASPDYPGADEHQTALFAHLVMQQTNMAMMLLGKVPHPETGQTTQDIESARIFIDMLEMLETRTKGNLTHEESKLLKQTLMTLRLAFVEAVESAPSAAQPRTEPTPATPQTSGPAEKTTPADQGATSVATEDEHRKKFSKKY
jgi:hypothetical protein